MIALFSDKVFAIGHIGRLSGLYLLLRHRLGTSESAGLDQESSFYHHAHLSVCSAFLLQPFSVDGGAPRSQGSRVALSLPSTWKEHLAETLKPPAFQGYSNHLFLPGPSPQFSGQASYPYSTPNPLLYCFTYPCSLPLLAQLGCSLNPPHLHLDTASGRILSCACVCTYGLSSLPRFCSVQLA